MQDNDNLLFSLDSGVIEVEGIRIPRSESCAVNIPE